MIYVLAALLPPLGLLLNGQPFAAIFNLVLLVVCLVILWDKIFQIALPILFTAYLVYGFIRPRISRKVRHEIEEEEENEDETPAPS